MQNEWATFVRGAVCPKTGTAEVTFSSELLFLEFLAH